CLLLSGERRSGTHQPTCGFRMFPIAETSLDTIADYEHDAIKFVGQYARECEPDACDIPGERLVVLAVCWFLNTHGRWSESYIRRLANALHQRRHGLLRWN